MTGVVKDSSRTARLENISTNMIEVESDIEFVAAMEICQIVLKLQGRVIVDRGAEAVAPELRDAVHNKVWQTPVSRELRDALNVVLRRYP